MSQKLKQAIAATRAGQSKEAQILLAQLLQENPSNTQAWYLLSLLVDSPSKKQAYLNKAVALDPTHEKAQQALVQLQATPEMPQVPEVPEVPEVSEIVEKTAVSEQPAIPAANDEPAITPEVGEEPIPDWLADVQPVVTETEAADYAEVEPGSPEEIPDWLTDTMGNGWVESEQPTLVSEPKPETIEDAAPEFIEDSPSAEDESILAALSDTLEPEKTSPTSLDSGADTAPTTQAKTKSPTAKWDRILWILIIGAIITLFMMVYMLLS